MSENEKCKVKSIRNILLDILFYGIVIFIASLINANLIWSEFLMNKPCIPFEIILMVTITNIMSIFNLGVIIIHIYKNRKN